MKFFPGYEIWVGDFRPRKEEAPNIAKSSKVWYNLFMANKKALKTIEKTKLEHRKTVAKSVAGKIVTEAKAVKKQTADNDNAWKEILDEHYFPKFLQFYFPNTFRMIDFGKPIEFLDKEFQKIGRDSAVGNKRVDKLVKVFLKNDQEKWILIHVEIQGGEDDDFAHRLYVYHYRIHDRYHKDVITLVILTDGNKKFRPEKYEVKYADTSITLRFGTVKLLDYKPEIAELEKNKNPFAVITLAYLRLIESKNDDAKKYFWKRTLIKSLYSKGYTQENIRQLYKFIDWIVTLPKEMEEKLVYEIKDSEEEQNMPIVTNMEKIAKIEMAMKMLEKSMDIKTIAEITGLPEAEIKRLKATLKKAA